MMRVITVAQPWADCIVFHGKTVENRTRNVAGAYRGLVAVHAGLRFDADARIGLRAAVDLRPRSELAHGAIIGVVDLVGVHLNTDPQGCLPSGSHEGRLRRCSPWAEPGAHHLVLANPRALVKPMPYRGMLGLRTLDPATEQLIMEGLA